MTSANTTDRSPNEDRTPTDSELPTSVVIQPSDLRLLNDLLSIRSLTIRDNLLESTDNTNEPLLLVLKSLSKDLDDMNFFCHRAISEYHHLVSVAIKNFKLSRGKASPTTTVFKITF